MNQSGKRWYRLAAYLLVVVAAFLGFWRVEQVQTDLCEQANEFRSDDLPAAFERFGHRLGDELDAPPERIETFVNDFDGDLETLFPEQHCGARSSSVEWGDAIIAAAVIAAAVAAGLAGAALIVAGSAERHAATAARLSEKIDRKITGRPPAGPDASQEEL